MQIQFIRNNGIYSKKELEKIRDTRVAIVGLGCTGSIVAEFLARVGVHSFVLIDGDEYEASNLNRQVNAVHSTLGKNKAKVTAERVKDINRDIRITHYPVFLKNDNAETLLSNCNFIVNGLDDPFAMVILHRTARKLKTDSIFLLSGVVPFQGITSIIEADNPIDYETLMGIPTKGKDISQNAEKIKKELFEKITIKRLESAIIRGALPGKWVKSRANGGPMISNGITSNLVGMIATNEIIKRIIKRSSLNYVSAPNILYYDGAKNLMEIRQPKNGRFWFQGDF